MNIPTLRSKLLDICLLFKFPVEIICIKEFRLNLSPFELTSRDQAQVF